MMSEQALSERAKHRLRLAARFLREAGHKFDVGNFYSAVLERIREMSTQEQERLRRYVDWVEAYEAAEKELYGNPPRSRAPKTKPRSGRKSNSTSSASGAGT